MLLLLIGIVFACDNHTKYYQTHQPIEQEMYFISSTFNYQDPCTPITKDNFKKLYPQYELFGVDVIYNGCDVNFMGNLIISNHEWLEQLKQSYWENAETEKKTVYGDIYHVAMNNVKQCCEQHEISFVSMVIIMLIIFIAMCGVGCYVYTKINNE